MSQVSCFFGFSCDILDPPGCYNPSFSSAEFPELSQCLAVALCTFFHQLLDEGSLVIIGVVNNLITGDDVNEDCTFISQTPRPEKITQKLY